ncbi:MAG: hypothetical protein IJ877_03020 [Candidatus Gastranaerophilales bacterium]|nr:hypothetical protein [Candidatus Gastranaerophilales bacterium]
MLKYLWGMVFLFFSINYMALALDYSTLSGQMLNIARYINPPVYNNYNNLNLRKQYLKMKQNQRYMYNRQNIPCRRYGYNPILWQLNALK